MELQFSTTERCRALEYLQKAYPSYDVNEDNAKEILDLVGVKIRIGDPMMYGPGMPVYPIGDYSTAEFKPVHDRFRQALTPNEQGR